MKRYDNEKRYLLILKANHRWEMQEYDPGRNLKMLQEACGGLIDRVASEDFDEANIDMWVSDEFLLNGSTINFKAALGAKTHICGDVAFLTNNPATGESFGLTKEQCLDIILHCEEAFADLLRDGNKRSEAENE